MSNRSVKRFSIIVVLLITGSIIGATGASAASTEKLPSAPISAFSMSDAEGGGGSPSVPPQTTSDIISNVGAVIRNAGGSGVIIRILDVVIRTMRVCPACFIP